MRVSLLNLLMALSVVGIVVGSAVSTQVIVAAAHPFNVSTLAASTVTVQPGVTFVLTGGYSNVTFAANLVATSSIQLPGYGKAIIVDGVNVSLVKIPASYPTAAVNFTTWNPTQTTIGQPLFIMRVTASLTSFYVNITGITANMFVLNLFDGVTGGGVITDGAGAAKFVFQTWVGSVHTIEFDAGAIQSSPGSPPGGGGIIASFLYGPHLGLLDAFTDNVMYFTDTSLIPQGFAPVVIIWKFGDGTTGNGSVVKHTYNFNFAANFNVTELICSQNIGTGGCSSTTRTVLLLAWHALAIGLFIAGMGVATFWILFRYARTGKTGLEKVNTVVPSKYRRR